MRKFHTLILSVMLMILMIPVCVLATDQSGEIIEPQPDQVHVCSFTLTSDTATCTEPGIKTYSCSGCPETKTEDSPAKGHSYGTKTKVDDANHEQICSVCGNAVTSGHNWNSGTVTTEANCQQSGTMTYACTDCGAEKTETLPKESTHDFSEWEKTEVGHTRSCDDCELVETDYHSWKEEIIEKPTCKDAGSQKKTCIVCSYTVSAVLPKLKTHTYDSVCDPECNVCSEKRSTEHTFTKVWSKDYSGHWHECTKCGEKKDLAKHIAGPAATEQQAQECLTCGYILTPKKEHEHKYEKKWTSDEAGHWYACTGCDDEGNYAAHSYKDPCDIDCDICGYEREYGHTYPEQWETSAREHWQICTVCSEKSKPDKHVPGPEATEKEPQTCTVCGYELAPVLIHDHDFENNWEYDEENHWLKCDCGELSVQQPHQWNKGVQVKKGLMEYRCIECNASKTETVKAGFPWVVVLILLALVCVGGLVVLVILLKRGAFDDDDFDYSQRQIHPDDEDASDILSDEIPAEEISDEDLNAILDEYL